MSKSRMVGGLVARLVVAATAIAVVGAGSALPAFGGDDDGYVNRRLDPTVTFCDKFSIFESWTGFEVKAPAGAVLREIIVVDGEEKSNVANPVAADVDQHADAGDTQHGVNDPPAADAYSATISRRVEIDGQPTYEQRISFDCVDGAGANLGVTEELFVPADPPDDPPEEDAPPADPTPGPPSFTG
jgi:hypothetical protein